MNPLLRSVLLFPLAIFAGEAFACMPAFPSEELARGGRNVLVGTVESKSFVQRPPGASVAGLSSTNNRSLAKPELLVRIRTLQLIHGKATPVITAVSPCALPLRVGERVVVATYSGRRIAFPADMYEESFRRAHAHDR